MEAFHSPQGILLTHILVTPYFTLTPFTHTFIPPALTHPQNCLICPTHTLTHPKHHPHPSLSHLPSPLHTHSTLTHPHITLISPTHHPHVSHSSPSSLSLITLISPMHHPHLTHSSSSCLPLITLISPPHHPHLSYPSLYPMQKKELDSPALEVKHFYYTVWPDHGVPQYATSLIKFIRRVRKFQSANPESTAPIIVHCRYVCMYVCM